MPVGIGFFSEIKTIHCTIIAAIGIFSWHTKDFWNWFQMLLKQYAILWLFYRGHKRSFRDSKRETCKENINMHTETYIEVFSFSRAEIKILPRHVIKNQNWDWMWWISCGNKKREEMERTKKQKEQRNLGNIFLHSKQIQWKLLASELLGRWGKIVVRMQSSMLICIMVKHDKKIIRSVWCSNHQTSVSVSCGQHRRAWCPQEAGNPLAQVLSPDMLTPK